jgi:hypothetical protein
MAPLALPPPPPSRHIPDPEVDPESVFWRCRDGPLASALARPHEQGAGGAGGGKQAEQAGGDDHGDGAASTLAAFAAASRDSREVIASSISSLRPSVLLPEAIARR